MPDETKTICLLHGRLNCEQPNFLPDSVRSSSPVLKGQKMSSDDSLEFKVGASEVGIKLGSGTIARLFPERTLNSDVRRFFTGRLLQNIQDGNLEEHDAVYAAAVLKPAEAELVNRMWIAKRAAALLEEKKAQAYLPAHNSKDPRIDNNEETEARKGKESASEDWLLKFWSDAGVVSDENVRELYARILAGEVNHPGSFSMRALKVLRYLDRQAAQVFGKVLPLIFNNMYLPYNKDILTRIPVEFNDLIELHDAELIVNLDEMRITPSGPTTILYWGDHMLRINHSSAIQIPVKILSKAGRDLCRVAEALRDTSYFFEVGRWLSEMFRQDEVIWAKFPNNVQGTIDIDSLNWLPIPSDEPTPLSHATVQSDADGSGGSGF